MSDEWTVFSNLLSGLRGRDAFFTPPPPPSLPSRIDLALLALNCICWDLVHLAYIMRLVWIFAASTTPLNGL